MVPQDNTDVVKGSGLRGISIWRKRTEWGAGEDDGV